jgi:methionyl-tRNA formyltransferase
LCATVQPADGVTYAKKVEKAEATVEWNLDADAIARRIRAFNPVPGAVARLHGEAVKLWNARAYTPALAPNPRRALP